MVGVRSRERLGAQADPFMFIIVGVLTTFGLVTIWSADGAGPITAGSNVARQAVYAVAGVIGMLALSSINYRFLKSFAIPIYVGVIVSLLSLYAVGTTIGGSTRWILVGPLSFQPSEFAKLGVLIALAAFLSDRHERMQSLHNFLFSGVIVGIPFLFVFVQPDLGTSGVLAAIWFATVAVSRTRMLYLVATVATAVPIALLSWRYFLHDYQKDRLMVSYDPYRDYFGDGFNIVQAHVTIGTSGWFGHGLSGGLQAEYEFLRVSTTDFIFAHAMSMFGFVGGIALFTAFVILFQRMTRVALQSRDTFGQYLAVGITAMIAFQTFVNIGMNLGLMPVTGIPLPFISLGGTALVTNLLAIGILQSIVINRSAYAFQARSPSQRRT
jgi:rod shape determining protein RodA